jgi:hypothetical protein
MCYYIIKGREKTKKGVKQMKYYHGTINREGQNIDVEGFQKVSGVNCDSEFEIGVFFTTNLKYACLYGGANRDGVDGEVWMIDDEVNPEITEKLQKFTDKCTNPDWTGYDEEGTFDEYILPWEVAEGFIPECIGMAKELFEA